MKTPLQEHIEWLESFSQPFIEIEMVIRRVQQLLPKEKEAICNAVTYGNRQDFYDGTETIGEHYYTQTFTNQTLI